MGDRVVVGRGLAGVGAARGIALELAAQDRGARDPLERGGADELLRVRLAPRAGESTGIEVEVAASAQHRSGDEVAVAVRRPVATVRADGAPDLA